MNSGPGVLLDVLCMKKPQQLIYHVDGGGHNKERRFKMEPIFDPQGLEASDDNILIALFWPGAEMFENKVDNN
jgi:hypothetical protein